MKGFEFDKITKTYKPNQFNKVQVEIGDEKQPGIFLPRAKLKVWENECNISVGLAEKYIEPLAVIEDDGDILKYKASKLEARFYELPPAEQYQEGGFEFDVVLYEKPDSNIIEFTLNTPKGLKFYYQPELTEEEKVEGAFQRENAIGSYAVYHATCGNLHRNADVAEKYKTGKAFHIFRPKITDAKDEWAWGELNVDVEAGIMSIAIDETWLDKATYPVIVDPTFGYTYIGYGGQYTNRNQLWATQFMCPSNATVNSISTHAEYTSGTCALKMALYSKTGETSGNFLETTAEEVFGGVLAWYTLDLEESVALSAYDYVWLFSWADAHVLLSFDYYPDFITFNASSTYDGNWPASISNNTHTITSRHTILSRYATYTDIATDPTVVSDPVSFVSYNKTTLNGELVSLAGETSVDVSFRYKKASEDWGDAVSTSPQALIALGSFSAEINLAQLIEYNCQAVVEWGAEVSYSNIVDLITPRKPLNAQHSSILPLARICQRGHKDNLDQNIFLYNNAGDGVVIYVFDTGVRVSHQDFEGRWDAGYDAYNPEGFKDAELDEHGHGTWCAGIAAGKVWGVAKKATIVSIKIRENSGIVPIIGVFEDACDWVIANHPEGSRGVACFGFPSWNAESEDGDRAEAKVLDLVAAGIVVCKSAGNNTSDASLYSINGMPEVVIVGATRGTEPLLDAILFNSNYGSSVDIFAPTDHNAPGKDSDTSTALGYIVGTSSSVAAVAGVMAIILSAYPELTPAQAKQLLIDEATTDAQLQNLPEGSPDKLLYSLVDEPIPVPVLTATQENGNIRISWTYPA